jgi:putative DNA primase/helicase
MTKKKSEDDLKSRLRIVKGKADAAAEESEDITAAVAKGDMNLEMATDLGNAYRLVRTRGEDMRYVPEWKKWLEWRDGWRANDDGAVMRIAKEMTVEMIVEAATSDESPEKKKKAIKHAIDSQKAARLRAMVDLASTELPVILHAGLIDSDIMTLGVTNGVIDLRDQTFRPLEREDLIVKRAGAAYDPKAKCPAWEKFLKRIISDPAMIEYIQRCFGYILTGETGEEVMFILYGGGANGKSTLREILFALLGDYAVAADAILLTEVRKQGGATPDVVRLHGRRLVTINETSDGDVMNEGRVKYITGTDKIAGRRLYEDLFDFTPTHKTVITTQHKPIVKGIDEGIWRRLHLWPFLVTIPRGERDIKFRARVLMPEMSGILNWALDGLRAYQEKGLQMPEKVKDSTEEYRADMDVIGQWIAERCEVDANALARTSTLYLDFKTWSEEEFSRNVMTVVAFGRKLNDRGFEQLRNVDAINVNNGRKDRGRGYRGLRLLF